MGQGKEGRLVSHELPGKKYENSGRPKVRYAVEPPKMPKNSRMARGTAAKAKGRTALRGKKGGQSQLLGLNPRNKKKEKRVIGGGCPPRGAKKRTSQEASGPNPRLRQKEKKKRKRQVEKTWAVPNA